MITVLGAGLLPLCMVEYLLVIQVPVIPNGDWTIGQGQSITLGQLQMGNLILYRETYRWRAMAN